MLQIAMRGRPTLATTRLYGRRRVDTMLSLRRQALKVPRLVFVRARCAVLFSGGLEGCTRLV